MFRTERCGSCLPASQLIASVVLDVVHHAVPSFGCVWLQVNLTGLSQCAPNLDAALTLKFGVAALAYEQVPADPLPYTELDQLVVRMMATNGIPYIFDLDECQVSRSPVLCTADSIILQLHLST